MKSEIETVTLDHLKMSKARRGGLFRNKFITEYDTPRGIVKEIYRKGEIPKYFLKHKRVYVNFSYDTLKDFLDDII